LREKKEMQLKSIMKRAQTCISRCRLHLSHRRRSGAIDQATKNTANSVALPHVHLIPLSKPSKKTKSAVASPIKTRNFTIKCQRIFMLCSTPEPQFSMTPKPTTQTNTSMICRTMSDNTCFNYVEFENIPLSSNGPSTNRWLLISTHTLNGTTQAKVGWRFCGFLYEEKEVEL
jgi:hypothetical protein